MLRTPIDLKQTPDPKKLTVYFFDDTTMNIQLVRRAFFEGGKGRQLINIINPDTQEPYQIEYKTDTQVLDAWKRLEFTDPTTFPPFDLILMDRAHGNLNPDSDGYKFAKALREGTARDPNLTELGKKYGQLPGGYLGTVVLYSTDVTSSTQGHGLLEKENALSFMPRAYPKANQMTTPCLVTLLQKEFPHLSITAALKLTVKKKKSKKKTSKSLSDNHLVLLKSPGSSGSTGLSPLTDTESPAPFPFTSENASERFPRAISAPNFTTSMILQTMLSTSSETPPSTTPSPLITSTPEPVAGEEDGISLSIEPTPHQNTETTPLASPSNRETVHLSFLDLSDPFCPDNTTPTPRRLYSTHSFTPTTLKNTTFATSSSTVSSGALTPCEEPTSAGDETSRKRRLSSTGT